MRYHVTGLAWALMESRPGPKGLECMSQQFYAELLPRSRWALEEIGADLSARVSLGYHVIRHETAAGHVRLGPELLGLSGLG